jgi:hypothetical protein
MAMLRLSPPASASRRGTAPGTGARPGAVGLLVLLPEPRRHSRVGTVPSAPYGRSMAGLAPEPELAGRWPASSRRPSRPAPPGPARPRRAGRRGCSSRRRRTAAGCRRGRPRRGPSGSSPLGVAAEGERPRAGVGAGRGDGAGLEAGQGGERLPGRAGRIGRLDGPVQQRLARAVGVAGEVAPGDAADEAARVVLGQAGQGEQGAVVGVEHDRGRRRGRVGAAPLAVGEPAGGPHAVGQGPLDALWRSRSTVSWRSRPGAGGGRRGPGRPPRPR